MSCITLQKYATPTLIHSGWILRDLCQVKGTPSVGVGVRASHKHFLMEPPV